jgi:hypothetical protein
MVMAEARDKAEYGRVAWMCSFIHNCNMHSEDDEPIEVQDCNPYLLEAKIKARKLAKKLNKRKPLPDKFNASKALAYYQRLARPNNVSQ